MQHFIRPSKSELLRVKNDKALIGEFIVLIDERMKLLSKEKLKLENVIKEKRLNLAKYKSELRIKAISVERKYGSLGLKRLSYFSRPSLEVKMNSELLAGVSYNFPSIDSSSTWAYPLTISSFEIDDLAKTTRKLMENIIDLSRYLEAIKKISYELNLIKRKLNALKNIVIPEISSAEKKIKNYLSEKDRFETVKKTALIMKIISSEL